jgi:hypothetical protein
MLGLHFVSSIGSTMIYQFAGCTLDATRRELRLGDDLVAVEPQVFDLLTLVSELAPVRKPSAESLHKTVMSFAASGYLNRTTLPARRIPPSNGGPKHHICGAPWAASLPFRRTNVRRHA